MSICLQKFQYNFTKLWLMVYYQHCFRIIVYIFCIYGRTSQIFFLRETKIRLFSRHEQLIIFFNKLKEKISLKTAALLDYHFYYNFFVCIFRDKFFSYEMWRLGIKKKKYDKHNMTIALFKKSKFDYSIISYLLMFTRWPLIDNKFCENACLFNNQSIYHVLDILLSIFIVKYNLLKTRTDVWHVLVRWQIQTIWKYVINIALQEKKNSPFNETLHVSDLSNLINK